MEIIMGNVSALNKSILILGNGFDLHCGLNTRFSDHIKYIINNSTIMKFKNLFNNKSIDVGSIVRLINEIDYTNPNYINNIWTYFFLFHYCKSNKNDWSDFELEMANSFIIKEGNSKNTWHKAFDMFSSLLVHQYTNPIHHQYEHLGCYLFAFKDKFESFSLSDFYVYLLEELKLYEKSLSEYIHTEIQKKGEKYKFNAEILINELLLSDKSSEHLIYANHKEVNLLSFNYTRLDTVYHFKSMVNIHGEIKHMNIIIGIDSVNIPFTNDGYLFTKTTRKLYGSITWKDSLKLQKDIKYVLIYGHSLNDQDYSYFQSLFDYLNIYESDVKIVFMYTIYDKKSK
jgi:hypothetical protein